MFVVVLHRTEIFSRLSLGRVIRCEYMKCVFYGDKILAPLKYNNKDTRHDTLTDTLYITTPVSRAAVNTIFKDFGAT